MRLFFPSAHRADNIAQLFKKHLKKLEIKRTDDAIREALAVACGYRNRNEMLNVLASNKVATPADEDTSAAEVASRSTHFIEKFAEALNLERQQAMIAYDAVRPFSGRSFLPKITKAQVEWLAANLTRRATEITPLGPLKAVAPRTFAGFSLTLDDGHEYKLEVAGNGDLKDRNSQDLAVLLEKAGFFKIPERIEHQSVANLHILSTLSRLDAKALFVLRHARLFSSDTYRFARSIPDSAPLMRALHTYPRLSPHFRWQVETHGEINLDDPTPLDTFAADVRQLSLKKWPSLPAPLERVRDISKNYLAVKPGTEGCIPLVVAFLIHMPDDTHPTTTVDYQKCEAFLFTHSGLFEANGFAVSHVSFADAFKSRYNKNWEIARKPGYSGSLTASSLAASVIAQAARECGYANAYAGDFEEPESEEFVNAFYDLGKTLLQENKFSWTQAIERLERLEQLLEARHKNWELAIAGKADLDEFYLEEDKVQYQNYAQLLLHPKHHGKSAVDILAERHFDLQGYIADSKDFGDTAYLPSAPPVLPPKSISLASGNDEGTVLFPVYISALWHDAVKKQSGTTTIVIKLPRALDEIIPLKRYRYARTLSDFSRAASDRIYSEHWVTYEGFNPVSIVCKAARELQFMCASGLVPSKKHSGPGRINGEFPEWDHGTSWIDPITGKTIFASEPYNAEGAEETCQDWAAANASTFLVSDWPGMYEPPLSNLILIARNEDAELLAKIDKALSLLNDAANSETLEFVEVDDGQVFFSPGERFERKGTGLVPPKENPWQG